MKPPLSWNVKLATKRKMNKKACVFMSVRGSRSAAATTVVTRVPTPVTRPISGTPSSPRRGLQLTAPQRTRRSLRTSVVLSAAQDTAGGVDPVSDDGGFVVMMDAGFSVQEA